MRLIQHLLSRRRNYVRRFKFSERHWSVLCLYSNLVRLTSNYDFSLNTIRLSWLSPSNRIFLSIIYHQLKFISHKKLKELGELLENKNKEVENMLVLVANLEQIENSLEFAADEVAYKH